MGKIRVRVKICDLLTQKCSGILDAFLDTGATLCAVPKNLADMLGIKPVYRRVVETACGIKNIDIGKCQICLVDYTDVFISQDVYILDTIKEPLIGYTLLEQLGLEYKPETGKIEHVGLLLL